MLSYPEHVGKKQKYKVMRINICIVLLPKVVSRFIDLAGFTFLALKAYGPLSKSLVVDRYEHDFHLLTLPSFTRDKPRDMCRGA